MKFSIRTALCLLVVGTFLMGGCNLGAKTPAATPTSLPSPTVTASPSTATPLPASPTPSLTPAAAQTALAPVQTPGGTPIATLAGSLAGSSGNFQDAAIFVSDVTIPDNTSLKPGEVFTKTWRIRNSGLSSWTTGYSLIYSYGNQLGTAKSVPFPQAVPPGQEVDLSVQMTAPLSGGQFTSFWMLKNAAGATFGVGPNANEPLYVMIRVSVPITPGPSITPGGDSTFSVTAATLSVNKTYIEDYCPLALSFNGSITSTGSGAYTYQVEAGTSTAGFTFHLPPAQKNTITSGGTTTLAVPFILEIQSSMDGWARLYISSPNSLRSSDVSFKVVCK